MHDGPPYMARLGRPLGSFLRNLLNGENDSASSTGHLSWAILQRISKENKHFIKLLRTILDQNLFSSIAELQFDIQTKNCEESQFKVIILTKIKFRLHQGDSFSEAVDKAVKETVITQIIETKERLEIEIHKTPTKYCSLNKEESFSFLEQIVNGINVMTLVTALMNCDLAMFQKFARKKTGLNDGPML